MMFTHNEVNFKVKYEDHWKCSKTYCLKFLKVFSDHHMWHQNWPEGVWTSLCQVKNFMNLIHSQHLWLFDIWHRSMPLPYTPNPCEMPPPTVTWPHGLPHVPNPCNMLPPLPLPYGPSPHHMPPLLPYVPTPCHMSPHPTTCHHDPLPHVTTPCYVSLAPTTCLYPHTLPPAPHVPTPAICLHLCHRPDPAPPPHTKTPATCPHTLSHVSTPCYMPPHPTTCPHPCHVSPSMT